MIDKDLEIILEVNKKAIEIENMVADQNEEIINFLINDRVFHEKTDEKLDKLIDQIENTSKDLFKIRVLFISGILALIAQVIQIFLHK